MSSPGFCFIEFPEILEEISNNFGFWEIIGEGEHHLSDIEHVFGELTPSYDMKFSFHAPFSDLNVASLNRWIREESLRQLKNDMERCARLGIDLVTVHPGLVSPLATYDRGRTGDLNRKSMLFLDKVASGLGVRLALENMPQYWLTTCHGPEELLKAIEGTEIGVCFDMGHANISGTLDAFLEHADRFVNVHIHDNDQTGDQHKVLGKGNIDFGSVLGKLSGYNGNYIIESTGLEEGVESARILYAMFEK